MLQRYTWLLLILPLSLFADQVSDSRAESKQAVTAPGAAAEIAPEVFRARAKQVRADVVAVIAKIDAMEKSGKTYPEAGLARLLRSRQDALAAEENLADKLCKSGCTPQMLRLDRDAILAGFADALTTATDRAAAVHSLGRRRAELSRAWVIKDENDPHLKGKGEDIELEVVNRNLLFDDRDEAGLAPELVLSIEKARLAFLEEELVTSGAISKTESPLHSGKPR